MLRTERSSLPLSTTDASFVSDGPALNSATSFLTLAEILSSQMAQAFQTFHKAYEVEKSTSLRLSQEVAQDYPAETLDEAFTVSKRLLEARPATISGLNFLEEPFEIVPYEPVSFLKILEGDALSGIKMLQIDLACGKRFIVTFETPFIVEENSTFIDLASRSGYLNGVVFKEQDGCALVRDGLGEYHLLREPGLLKLVEKRVKENATHIFKRRELLNLKDGNFKTAFQALQAKAYQNPEAFHLPHIELLWHHEILQFCGKSDIDL